MLTTTAPSLLVSLRLYASCIYSNLPILLRSVTTIWMWPSTYYRHSRYFLAVPVACTTLFVGFQKFLFEDFELQHACTQNIGYIKIMPTLSPTDDWLLRKHTCLFSWSWVGDQLNGRGDSTISGSFACTYCPHHLAAYLAISQIGTSKSVKLTLWLI